MAILSPFVDLQCGDLLLDCDEVSRYCSPDRFSQRLGEPKVSAFQKKPTEVDPSVNRLQYFKLRDRSLAVECIKHEFRTNDYTLKPKGRFVVFNVGAAKAAAIKSGYRLVFRFTPDPPVWSHSSIQNFPQDADGDLVVATALKRLITKSDIFDAVP